MKPPTNIETARLFLRPPTLQDAEWAFQNYTQDHDVTRYMTWRPHQDIEETLTYLRRCVACWENETAFAWVLVRKENAELLGMIEIRVQDWKADVGYVLKKSAWGNGYMSEALSAVVQWALAQPGIYRVWAVCDVDNAASARVMEKVGMQREGLLRRWIVHPNMSAEPRDSLCYAIVK